MGKGVRALQKEARPREILEAAFEEFVLRGYAATRLEDVAARVGVTKGTIYVYFKDKEHLFETMVTELSQPVVDISVYERALDDVSALNVLEQFVTDICRMTIEDRYSHQIVRFLVSEASPFQGLLERYERNFAQPVFAILQMIIDRGCERGEFRSAAREYHPSFLISPLLGTTLMMSIVPGARSSAAEFRSSYLRMLRRLLQQ